MNQRICGKYLIILFSLIVLFFPVSATFGEEISPSPIATGDSSTPTKDPDLKLKPPMNLKCRVYPSTMQRKKLQKSKSKGYKTIYSSGENPTVLPFPPENQNKGERK
ncbi:MAG: hypothetical protein JW786_06645 [Desulfobacterales bacterium]|nr:hypothetical protein [Desulfobacterales bacterium]